jgi:hypothetical protein
MDSREAFEKHADQYDNFGDEWQDMGLDKHFIAGYEAGQASSQAIEGEPVGYVVPRMLEAMLAGKYCGISMTDEPKDGDIGLYTHAVRADVQEGRSKKWLKTLDRWIDLMTRLKGQPLHTSMQQEVDRVRTEVMRYREYKVLPATSNEQDQPQ